MLSNPSRPIALFYAVVLLCCGQMAQAQDSTKNVSLDYIEVLGNRPVPERLRDAEGTSIYAGKKNEVIRLTGIDANLITNNARQVFSRVPGISIWETDGSGVQVSVGARGLSPNRSWEFNTRQNGYDMSSDVFGYPEAYYNPPMEAVEKIQIVRGAASLQFGPQFGGLLNYILKRAPQDKPFNFETQNAIGSYGLLSSFIGIGGNTKKWGYYVYNHSRKGNGWRQNSRYEVRNTHAFLQYKFNEKASLSIEYTNMDDAIQQSGGLTDAQFEANSRQSLRARNWMATPWQLANVQFDYRPSEKLSFNVKVFGLLGERKSVGFLSTPLVADTINAVTNAYNHRQVDIDHYQNWGAELRGMFHYDLFNQKHHLAFGARAYQARTKRSQRGKGSTGSDFDTQIATEIFPTEYQFNTQNFALFAENTFAVTEHFSVTPGVRFENVSSSIEGRANVVNGAEVNVTPQSINRIVLLAGLGLEYKIKATNFYANFSQAYRPVLFSELVPPTTTDVVDPDLSDASGFNADLGYRGSIGSYLNFDVGAFYLYYNNRVGTIRRFINDDPTQSTYQYRTNLGKSINMGIEAYLEFNLFQALKKGDKWGNLSVFASMAFINAEYVDFKTTTISGTAPNVVIQEGNLKGNRVENAPGYIHNFGLTYGFKNVSFVLQTRMCGEVYSDASNTETPGADGLAGKIPSYTTFDLSAQYQFLQHYNIKAGINNLTDVKYATRRSGGYPGPGLVPGEGRTFYVSVGAKF